MIYLAQVSNFHNCTVDQYIIRDGTNVIGSITVAISSDEPHKAIIIGLKLDDGFKAKSVVRFLQRQYQYKDVSIISFYRVKHSRYVDYKLRRK